MEIDETAALIKPNTFDIVDYYFRGQGCGFEAWALNRTGGVLIRDVPPSCQAFLNSFYRQNRKVLCCLV